MLSEKMTTALNDHLNKEIFSAYLYMSMSAWCSGKGLKGMAKWFMCQYHEEMFHGMQIHEYILRQGQPVQLDIIAQPQQKWESALDVFESTLEHEQGVTRRVNNLMDLAIEERDHATQIFLQWFVTEQIEEEDNCNEIVTQIKLIEGDAHALLILDRELGARTVTVPTDYSNGVSTK